MLDGFEWLLTSPATWLVALGTMVAVLAWQAVEGVRREQAFHKFLRQHGFRLSPTGSTMWLARLIERSAALSSDGYWDGFPVTIERRRRGGLIITMTAASNLAATPSQGRVSLGAWTRPSPPALLVGAPLEADGRQLRLWTGDVLDLAPYLTALAAYARALTVAPVNR